MPTVQKDVSGCLATRVVGVIEVLVYFGFFIYFIVTLATLKDTVWDALNIAQSCGEAAYLIVGLVISVVLIVATFKVFSLSTRKWIGATWCIFDMTSFIGFIVLLCLSNKIDVSIAIMTVGLVKGAVFFAVVSTYVWGLSELIQDTQMGRMASSPARPGQRTYCKPVGGGVWMIKKRENHKMRISTKL